MDDVETQRDMQERLFAVPDPIQRKRPAPSIEAPTLADEGEQLRLFSETVGARR